MREKFMCMVPFVVMALMSACSAHQDAAATKTDAAPGGQKTYSPGPDSTPTPTPSAQPTRPPISSTPPQEANTFASDSRKIPKAKVLRSSRKPSLPADPRIAELIDELTSPQRTIETRIAWAEEEFQKRGIDVRHDNQ